MNDAANVLEGAIKKQVRICVRTRLEFPSTTLPVAKETTTICFGFIFAYGTPLGLMTTNLRSRSMHWHCPRSGLRALPSPNQGCLADLRFEFVKHGFEDQLCPGFRLPSCPIMWLWLVSFQPLG